MSKVSITIVSLNNIPAQTFADGKPEEMIGVKYSRNGEPMMYAVLFTRTDGDNKARSDEQVVSEIKAQYATAEDFPAPLVLQLSGYSVFPCDVLDSMGAEVTELGSLGEFELDE